MADFKWEETANRMIVSPVGYDEARVLIGLPSRRWRKTANQYVVPITRMNADILLKSALVHQIPVPLRKHLTDITSNPKFNREFPAWYRFQPFEIKGEKFNGQPLPDQWGAIRKLYPVDTGALLMPMGVGKSKALIDMCTAHYLERRIDTVLVIAPLTTVGVWTGAGGQLDLHSPVKTKRVHADSSTDWTKHRPKADELMWVTLGLESLSQGSALKRILPLVQNRKVAVVVDESHWIKTDSANRTKAVKEIRKFCKMAYIMTGTPLTKSLIDFYSQYDFLDPNIIGVGDYYAFRNRYCLMGGFKRKEIIGYDNVDEMMGLIDPYTYICEEPKGLPPKTWTKRQITMSPEQFEMYQKVKKAEIPTISVKNVLNKVLRLSQICAGFLDEDPQKELDPISKKMKVVAKGKRIWSLPPEKNPKLVDIVEQVLQEPDRQFILWSKHLFEIESLRHLLAKHGPTCVMTGATENRDLMVADFQAGKYKYMVANTTVGGISWTLTAATRGYYASNTDKYDDRQQSEKRIHRQGQKHAVLYTDWEMRTPRGGATTDTMSLAANLEKMDLDQWVKQKLLELGNKIEDLY